MTKILQHHIFWSENILYSDCFKNTNSLTSFNSKLKKVVDNYILTLGVMTDSEREEKFRQLYGDGGEVFVEVLIHLTKYCPQFKIYDYIPTTVDYEGVDGYAKRNNDNVAIQVKWYKPDAEVSGHGGIMAFKGKAQADLIEMGTIPNMSDGPKNLILITSGKGMTFLAEENSNNLIQVINKDDIKRIVGYDNDGGNSLPFWADAYQIVHNTETHYKGK